MSLGKTSKTTNTTWKKIAIPDSKLVGVFVNQDGRASLQFEIADTSACKGIFYVSARCVRRNADRTGFICSMPEGEVKVTEGKKVGDEWQKKSLTADSLAELGYPFVD